MPTIDCSTCFEILNVFRCFKISNFHYLLLYAILNSKIGVPFYHLPMWTFLSIAHLQLRTSLAVDLREVLQSRDWFRVRLAIIAIARKSLNFRWQERGKHRFWMYTLNDGRHIGKSFGGLRGVQPSVTAGRGAVKYALVHQAIHNCIAVNIWAMLYIVHMEDLPKAATWKGSRTDPVLEPFVAKVKYNVAGRMRLATGES